MNAQHSDGIVTMAKTLHLFVGDPADNDPIGTAIANMLLELSRAGLMFPEWPDDPIHAAAVVAEEAGELVKTTLQYVYEEGAAEEVRKEAIHTMATAARFLVNWPPKTVAREE